jgi:hypothetical protein
LTYIVTCTPIARQRVGKHVPAEENARNSMTSIAKQWSCRHAFLTRTVFSVWSVQRSYLEDNRRYKFRSRYEIATGSS